MKQLNKNDNFIKVFLTILKICLIGISFFPLEIQRFVHFRIHISFRENLRKKWFDPGIVYPADSYLCENHVNMNESNVARETGEESEKAVNFTIIITRIGRAYYACL